MLTRAFLMLEVAKQHRATREMGDRIWDMGGGGRWKGAGGRDFGEGNQYRKYLEGLGLE
jgi:hypothetical protein